MSKSTKMIAALGIVAGLGIATLPLGAVSADTVNSGTSPQSVTVDLEMQVAGGVAIGIDNTTVNAASTVIAGGAVVAGDVTTAITTSANSNYVLSFAGDTENGSGDLVGYEDTTVGEGNKGNASGGTNIELGTPAQRTSAWGVTFNNSIGRKTSFGTIYTSTDGGSEVTNTGTYDFSASSTQKAGPYKGGIIYTVTASS